MTVHHPLRLGLRSYLPARSWRVTTTAGTVEVMAATLADAIRAGLELTGPRSTLLSCLQAGDW